MENGKTDSFNSYRLYTRKYISMDKVGAIKYVELPRACVCWSVYHAVALGRRNDSCTGVTPVREPLSRSIKVKLDCLCQISSRLVSNNNTNTWEVRAGLHFEGGRGH